MAYEKSGTIQSSDYNTLIAEINKVFGIGTGDKGYGGFATGPGSKEPGFNAISELPSKTSGESITTRDWLNLRNAYEDCARHQGSVLTVQQKSTKINPTYNTNDTIIIKTGNPTAPTNTYTINFVSGDITLTGTQIPPGTEYKTSDGITINGTPVNFLTGDVSTTGTIGATYTTDDGILINGTPVNFTIGVATETGSVNNPTTFGETLTINGTDVVLATPTAEISAGFNEFLGTVGEGEVASFTGVTAVDDGGAPITPVYSLFSGTLPTGLTINPSSGLISGTVTDGSISADTVYNFVVDATDGTSAQQNFNIHVNCATFEAGIGTTATGRTQVDTTTFVNDLNFVYGLGSGTTGYGQSQFTTPTFNQEVSTADLFNWKGSISDMASHQGIILAPPLPADSLIQDPKPWDAEGFFNTLLTNLNQVELAPTLVSGGSTVVTVNPDGVDQTRIAAWSSTVDHHFTVAFVDQDHARAFFNAGGQIRISASRTGGSVTTQNTAWDSLLSTVPPAFIGTDYFNLTTSYTTFFATEDTSGGAYDIQPAPNKWTILAKTNTTVDPEARGGNGNVITFQMQFLDQHLPLGSSPWPIGPDFIDGTFTSTVSEKRATDIFVKPQPSYTLITPLTSGV